MRIYGLDFTSAPSRKKPLVLATACFDDATLRIEQVDTFAKFDGFENLLRREGPWVAGLDFPFGQPRKLIDKMGWDRSWSGYVEHVGAMTKPAFVDTLDVYMAPRPKGDKLHFRDIDRLARAQSPMTIYFIPVARMFYEGAPRLLHSDVSIIPNRPTNDNRVVVEAYPALLARRFGKSYKHDNKDKQTDARRAARAHIVEGLRENGEAVFGFSLNLPGALADAFIEDPTGDRLDAALCAVLAAWASTRPNYGVPVDADPLEGWIVDPDLERTP